ncbi:hypothetical protein NDU88_001182 [Pleurodeles waltl]|uniref:Uncharacterized protein n=1 Tax=Pleurodeles waltl TaxID=8319 RepID=A0AAV7RA28_PLEWA|nr:hypothetical protein NDU88_001182 [Pleurodeles waltl]
MIRANDLYRKEKAAVRRGSDWSCKARRRPGLWSHKRGPPHNRPQQRYDCRWCLRLAQAANLHIPRLSK